MFLPFVLSDSRSYLGGTLREQVSRRHGSGVPTLTGSCVPVRLRGPLPLPFLPARRLHFLAPHRLSFPLGDVPPAYSKSSRALTLGLLFAHLSVLRLAGLLHVQSVEDGQGETHHPKG
jgi:hypothetical protein